MIEQKTDAWIYAKCIKINLLPIFNIFFKEFFVNLAQFKLTLRAIKYYCSTAD